MSPESVAAEIQCSLATVYRIRRNLITWGSSQRGNRRPHGRRAVPELVAAALEQYLQHYPCAYQDEMQDFLREEYGFQLSQSGVSKLLKRRRFSRKRARRVSQNQSILLRCLWKAEIIGLRASQCVFVDESAFNERTGWRHFAYSQVGQPGRYRGDTTRGRIWSVLPAYTSEGYLSCTLLKEGAIDGDEFYRWVVEDLLPCCNRYPQTKSVIIMDNCQTHIKARIEEAVLEAGCEIKYLPPYSPDFNPIELTFSVLKSWIRRHFTQVYPTFEGDFEAFLKHAIAESYCDRHAEAHFAHCEYLSDVDFDAIMELRTGRRELDEVEELEVEQAREVVEEEEGGEIGDFTSGSELG